MISRRRIFTWLYSVLAVLFMAAAASLVWLHAGDSKMLSVQSGSMAPAISKGSLIIVNNVPDNRIKTGDVITYINPADKSTTITHRVTAVLEDDPQGNRFVTKGDANQQPDQPIESVGVIGRVDKTFPYAGRVIDALKNPVGLALAIYLPTLLIVAGEYKRLANYYRRMRPYSLYGFRHSGYKGGKSIIAGLVLMLSLGALSIRPMSALAELSSTAALDGNTISIIQPEEKPKENTKITCKNKTKVKVNISTDQTSQSGNAEVAGNTDGGSATSGSASNSNTVNVSGQVSNNCTSQT